MLGGYGALGGSIGFGTMPTMPMAAPQMMTSQRMVDVPVPHVQTRDVPRVETQIVDRLVARVEVQEKIGQSLVEQGIGEQVARLPTVEIVEEIAQLRNIEQQEKIGHRLVEQIVGSRPVSKRM